MIVFEWSLFVSGDGRIATPTPSGSGDYDNAHLFPVGAWEFGDHLPDVFLVSRFPGLPLN